MSRSEILNDPDEHEDEPKRIDPPAFDGYIGFIWTEFLDRWLW
ncbi:hypothetical protein [Streptomyces antnestii]|nr:hypothetical protein [Streptomyces sp. San01]